MKHKIFCIYDGKAKAYFSPFVLPEIGMAVRTFSDCVNDPNHNFGRHPEDYTLFCAGVFDDSAGAFEIESMLVCVAHGIELVKRVEDVGQISLGLRNGEVRGPVTAYEGSK